MFEETRAAQDGFKDNISAPSFVALARPRKVLDQNNCKGVTLVHTTGLPIENDFTKAWTLGADPIAIAIGCLGMRAYQFVINVGKKK